MSSDKYTIGRVDGLTLITLRGGEMIMPREGTVVVTAPDGVQYAPPCGEDLLALYNYEVNRSKSASDQAAQELLAAAMRGDRPVTRLVETVGGMAGALSC